VSHRSACVSRAGLLLEPASSRTPSALATAAAISSALLTSLFGAQLRSWVCVRGGVQTATVVRSLRLTRHKDLAAAGLIAALIAANYFVFRGAFRANYFRWYLENGTVLGLVLATAAVGLNLDAEDGLISSRPDHYLLSWMQLVANLFFQMSAILIGPYRRKPRADASSGSHAGRLRRTTRAMLDILALIVVIIAMGLGLTFLILAGVILGMIAWIVVVAPLQYFLYLICGGPARTFKNTQWSDEGLPKGSLGFVERVPVARNPAPPTASDTDSHATERATPTASDAAPVDGSHLWQTVYSARPVTFTTSVAALVLWILNQLA
jgi:hypothetical protein